MEQLQQLQPVLNEILQTISDTLGYPIDTLKANISQYLAEYGRYALIKDIKYHLVIPVLLSAVGILVLLPLASFIIDEILDIESERGRKVMSIITKIIIISGVLIAILPTIFVLLQYLASPEIYGLEHLLNLIK